MGMLITGNDDLDEDEPSTEFQALQIQGEDEIAKLASYLNFIASGGVLTKTTGAFQALREMEGGGWEDTAILEWTQQHIADFCERMGASNKFACLARDGGFTPSKVATLVEMIKRDERKGVIRSWIVNEVMKPV